MNTKMPSYHGVWKSLDDQRGGAAGPMACVALGLFFLLVAAIASAAEPFIEIGVGQTHYLPIEKDDYWVQDAFPYSRQLNSIALRAGLGLKFNAQWSATLSYLRLGRNSVTSQAVSDGNYDPVNHVCIQPCEALQNLYVVGAAQGPELAVTYTFTRYAVKPYLRTGLFLWLTSLHADISTPSTGASHAYDEHGMLIASFIGGGLRWKGLFAEVSYYRGFGGGGFPIAKVAIVPMIGGRYEF